MSSLLLRPLFIKFSLLTTKQIISPATSTREKFSGSAVLGLGQFSDKAVLVLVCQMSWHVILIFRIILISKRGYRSRLYYVNSCLALIEQTPNNKLFGCTWMVACFAGSTCSKLIKRILQSWELSQCYLQLCEEVPSNQWRNKSLLDIVCTVTLLPTP